MAIIVQMAAPSPVLFALNHSIEPQGFEKLCVDLLIREGHSRIIPGGRSRDHGRDAEVRFWISSKVGTPQTAFQFSMEAKWEAKLRKDISKIVRHSDSINRVVFVSSRPISIERQDKLRAEFRASHQISLEILDEGWFRVRLEEDHVDLALKHLGVAVAPTPGFYATQIKLHGLTDENQEEMLRHRSPHELRATLAAQTQADPSNAGAWKGLAHVCNYLHDYESALLATAKALKLSQDEVERWNLTALKASIYAEQGIASGSRLLLKKAKELFTPFINHLGRAIDHYNLANILGALEQREEAERHYRRCLELEPNDARAWQNLGSLLVKLKHPDEGMNCLNRALELKPNMLEALCTKANVLVMLSDDCTEAIELMERAFELDPDLEARWPHAHYWYALALCREDRLPEALMIVEDRLERKFDCQYLGRLANDILAKLWRSDSSYMTKAEKFFALRIDSKERDYRALIEMLDLLDASNREAEAWSLLEYFLGVEELSIQLIAERIPLAISDLTDAFASVDYYHRFRLASPLADYAHMLDDCGLRSHDEVPEILFHLLLPAYVKLGATLHDVDSQKELEVDLEVVLDTYRLVSRTFAGFGGWLASPDVPESIDRQAQLITGAAIVGLDVPLIEVSRLLGFLLGIAKRDFPESYRDAIVKATPAIHETWFADFLTAIGVDWNIESRGKSGYSSAPVE